MFKIIKVFSNKSPNTLQFKTSIRADLKTLTSLMHGLWTLTTYSRGCHPTNHHVSVTDDPSPLTPALCVVNGVRRNWSNCGLVSLSPAVLCCAPDPLIGWFTSLFGPLFIPQLSAPSPVLQRRSCSLFWQALLSVIYWTTVVQTNLSSFRWRVRQSVRNLWDLSPLVNGYSFVWTWSM